MVVLPEFNDQIGFSINRIIMLSFSGRN